jgi:hypothetical protein
MKAVGLLVHRAAARLGFERPLLEVALRRAVDRALHAVVDAVLELATRLAAPPRPRSRRRSRSRASRPPARAVEDEHGHRAVGADEVQPRVGLALHHDLHDAGRADLRLERREVRRLVVDAVLAEGELEERTPPRCTKTPDWSTFTAATAAEPWVLAAFMLKLVGVSGSSRLESAPRTRRPAPPRSRRCSESAQLIVVDRARADRAVDRPRRRPRSQGRSCRRRPRSRAARRSRPPRSAALVEGHRPSASRGSPTTRPRPSRRWPRCPRGR